MKNLIIIFLLSMIITLGGCGNKALIYQGTTTEGKSPLLFGTKKYDKQQRLRAQHNARRAYRL